MKRLAPLKIRFVEKEDLFDLVECEIESHQFFDPDFEVLQLPPYVWGENDFMRAISQYKSKKSDTYDTRTLVADLLQEDEQEKACPWTCGAIVYEIQPLGYQILLLTAHPKAPDHVRAELLDYVMKKAVDSEKRKKIRALVPDGDYVTLKFYQDAGFEIFLQPSTDHWRCEYEIPIER